MVVTSDGVPHPWAVMIESSDELVRDSVIFTTEWLLALIWVSEGVL